jgi:hypothetical protein
MRIGMMWSTMAIPALIGPVISGRECDDRRLLTTELISIGGDRFKYAGIFTGCTFLISGLFTVAPSLWVMLRSRGQTVEHADDIRTPANFQLDGKTVVETEDVEDKRAKAVV